jgi:hypothetical protein
MMFSRISAYLVRLRRQRAPACLALLAGVSTGGPLTAEAVKPVSPEVLSVSERIRLVRAAYQEQTKPEAKLFSRWLLAQWYNFGNFRPPPVPYNVPQYYPMPAPVPQAPTPYRAPLPQPYSQQYPYALPPQLPWRNF